MGSRGVRGMAHAASKPSPGEGRARSGASPSTVSIVMVLLAASFVLVGPWTAPVAATHEYALVRLGSHDTAAPIRSLDVSDDGRWIAAGTLGESVRLFDFDAGPPFDPVWTSADIDVADGGGYGSSHSVSMSRDGAWIAAGTSQTTACADPTASGCLFVFRRDGGGVPAWSQGFADPVYSTDVADAYVVAGVSPTGGRVHVFDLAGTEYWNYPVGGAQVVRITADGRYLAVSSQATVRFFENTGTGFALVWTRAVTDSNVNIDLAEDGRALVAGEDDPADLPGGSDFYMFAPGANGWDAADATPCLRVNQPNDVYAVAVAAAGASATDVRALAGGTWGDMTDQFALCAAVPETQWTTPVVLAADTALAGCTGPTPCFSALGGFNGSVVLAQERDAVTESDATGAAVHAIAMSPEALPAIAAGNEAGTVYFYGVFPDAVDYAPWRPVPAVEVRVGVGATVTLQVSVRNLGGRDPRVPSTIAFADEGAPSPFLTATVDPLPPGWESPPFPASWTAPSVPGRYRVLATVDYGDAIVEWDETNNAYAFVLNVTEGPLTSLVVGSPRVDGQPTYVTSATPLTLSVEDRGGGVASTAYRIDGGPWTSYAGPFTASPEGERLVEFNSTDDFGVGEPTRQALLRVDDTPPATVAGVGDPKHVAAYTYVTSRTPLNLSAADGGVFPVGVNATEHRIDGGAWAPYLGPFTLAGEGLHSIEFRATDRLGNLEVTQSLAVVVDDTPPVLLASLAGPIHFGAATFVAANTTVDVGAMDPGTWASGVASLSCQIDGGPLFPYVAPFPLPSPDGPKAVECRATDRLGNDATVLFEVVLDATPPIMAADPGAGTYPPSATFAVNVTDAGSGVASLWYRVDGGDWIPYAGPFALPLGEHTVDIRAVDNVTNAAEDSFVATLVGPSVPPAEPNWKPVVAAVFAAVLVAVGAWSAHRRSWRTVPTRKRMVREFAIASLPFVLAEVATGVVSFATGLLAIPPLLGPGTAVNMGILIAGLAVAVVRGRAQPTVRTNPPGPSRVQSGRGP